MTEEPANTITVFHIAAIACTAPRVYEVPNFSKRHNLSETWLSELEAPVQDPDIFFDEEGQESALTLLAHVLREILHWICEGNRNRGGYALTVARKVIAMAWVLRPEIFDGLSLTAICKSKGVEDPVFVHQQEDACCHIANKRELDQVWQRPVT